ncbi:MAG TPA: DNA translocase FtsK 4TM domain-containing protein [Polyangia bacterium]|jgi:S-DNA-T family DNA segregation ATPase FtsK/SpoIIIE|nr:DNA translocase FtsK 4TM domain-containing protein [Polyangia bacterium]
MAAKTDAEPRGKGRQGRRREIVGIVFLAFCLFAGLSLFSMQLGSNRMMGPGGATTASALYGLAGFGAYLLIAAMGLAAVRCFRSVRVVDGFSEGLGALMLFGSAVVLMHLPFSEQHGVNHGPGGLLGQWLGEVTASFIGAAGAALAAATVLVLALMLLGDLSTREVVVVVGWALRQAQRGTVASLRAVWGLARAAFPERVDDADEDERALEDERDDIKVIGPESAAALEAASDESPLELEAIPASFDHHEESDSDAIRAVQTRALSQDIADERAAMAAIVAEVAAVEQVSAPEEMVGEDDVEDEQDEPSSLAVAAVTAAGVALAAPMVAHAAPVVAAAPAPAEGPIIVEPAWRTRQRQEQEAAEAAVEHPRPVEAAGPGFIKLTKGAYELPGTDMLEYIPPQAHEMDKQALYDMAERVEQAMSNYGVRGKVKEIHMGPVVTMYEFAPAPGTRTGKIANLEKDLAMALEAQAVRIVAPIPGKAVVGVEVPNKAREMVYLKEILEDPCFTTGASKLQMCLGKDIKGTPVSFNLSKMPHLLVAGTTGSGKSVAVNGMITSVLYNASPEDVRFIMVDPKMLELSIYEGIPHLLLPVVTDPKKANLALRWAVDEMERRYELLAKTGVRDIASYNAKLLAAESGTPAAAAPAAPSKKIRVVLAGADGTEQEVEMADDAVISGADNVDGVVQAEAPDAEDLSNAAAAVQAAAQAKADAGPPPRKLPYIIIVIDEFADLMMVAPKDVETSVARIAQKARAAGLHLILATQRPSVDVITGLIKANFPSRIALQVASRIDSRTILDQSGAETLLGNGDMLFSDRGTKLRRIHGAFLSDDEVHRVVEFLKKQAKPVYDMDILKPREEDAEEGAPAEQLHDDLYDQAVAIVCETRQASVSFIQRRLQIGYNRAARMVEQMERDGIVGPANGAKPREVVAPPGEYLQQAG